MEQTRIHPNILFWLVVFCLYNNIEPYWSFFSFFLPFWIWNSHQVETTPSFQWAGWLCLDGKGRSGCQQQAGPGLKWAASANQQSAQESNMKKNMWLSIFFLKNIIKHELTNIFESFDFQFDSSGRTKFLVALSLSKAQDPEVSTRCFPALSASQFQVKASLNSFYKAAETC